MPRRVLDSDSDSQKENQNVGSSMPKQKVKAEKGATVAGSKTKLTRVASRVEDTDDEEASHAGEGEDNAARKTHDGTLTSGSGDGENIGGEEGGEEDDEDEDDNDVSPNGRKRARINEEGDAMPIKKEERVKAPHRVTFPRDKDG
jgi:structural maintenance of chromosomes protein 5